MVYPDPKSEKGISAYSENLIENIKKQKTNILGISFIAGNPFSLFKKLKTLLKYDIIHIQHEYNMLGWFGLPYFFFLGFLCFIKKKKLIVTMHTILSQKERFRSGKFKTFLRKLLYHLQNRWINLTSKKIVVHAKFFREILIKEYSVPKEKIVVLPHAIIENIKTVSKKRARKELNLSGNVYLLIGVMGPLHGHDIIIKQADKIGKTVLVATNPISVNDRNLSRTKNFLDYNKQIVKENNFQNFVRFDLGEIPYKKWWKYFAASDLILLPYRGGIGSGIFADAMAMKKPVVASNAQYFKEFAKNYGCLVLAKNDKDFPRAIKSAMKSKNYLEMQKECSRFFNENGLTPISKKYQDLYLSLINSR